MSNYGISYQNYIIFSGVIITITQQRIQVNTIDDLMQLTLQRARARRREILSLVERIRLLFYRHRTGPQNTHANRRTINSLPFQTQRMTQDFFLSRFPLSLHLKGNKL